MGLSDFQPKVEKVQFPGGEFTVRGLSLEDITTLLRTYYPQARTLFDKYVGESAAAAVDEKYADGALGMGDVQDVVLDALESAPGMIADTVARAADEPDRGPLVRQLPTGVQVTAIEKVVRLTLEAEGGLEKLVESVTKLAGTLTTAIPAKNDSP